MASRTPQTMAKRAREQAVKEKRDLKRARKLERAAARAAGTDVPTDADAPEVDADAAEVDAGEPGETPDDGAAT